RGAARAKVNGGDGGNGRATYTGETEQRRRTEKEADFQGLIRLLRSSLSSPFLCDDPFSGPFARRVSHARGGLGKGERRGRRKRKSNVHRRSGATETNGEEPDFQD